jgi:3D (Asp-Asp-Asp) domain-containing protein
MRPGLLALAAALAASSVACVTQGGNDWMRNPSDASGSKKARDATYVPETDDGGRLIDERREIDGDPPPAPPPPPRSDREAGGQDDVLVLRDRGRARGAGELAELGDGMFRNTYYDFPSEGGGPKDATLFDPTCRPIATVTRVFHDQVCVQGSGRLASGATVAFAARGCPCAATCPRTGQQICFERLDPSRFPSGRGATGRPITPLRSVAVDTSVIPLGTPLYIPELAGLPGPGGAPHDGCFVAEDRGMKVVGRQVDVFTGDPSQTQRWNVAYPSNRGVHVQPNDPRCAHLAR